MASGLATQDGQGIPIIGEGELPSLDLEVLNRACGGEKVVSRL